MIPFLTNKSKHNPINLGTLQKDKIANEIGSWKIEHVLHDKKVTFRIVRDAQHQFIVALADNIHPIKVLSTQQLSLESSVLFLNNFLGNAANHDLAIFLDRANKAKVVIGR